MSPLSLPGEAFRDFKTEILPPPVIRAFSPQGDGISSLPAILMVKTGAILRVTSLLTKHLLKCNSFFPSLNWDWL